MGLVPSYEKITSFSERPNNNSINYIRNCTSKPKIISFASIITQKHGKGVTFIDFKMEGNILGFKINTTGTELHNLTVIDILGRMDLPMYLRYNKEPSHMLME